MKVSGRILCINDDFDLSLNRFLLFKPQKGQIYTIREVIETRNGLGFLLDEIVNKPIEFRDGRKEPCFLSSRFRLIDELGDKEDVIESVEVLEDFI